jgi:hypothetical protein
MPNTNAHGPKRAILCTCVSRSRPALQTPNLNDQSRPIASNPAPSSIRGTDGQHRKEGSRAKGRC